MTSALLPRSIPPLIGEIFSSWISRLANANQLSVKKVLERCGYTFTGTSLKPAGYNLYIPPEILEQTSRITYIDPDVLQQTVLARYRNSPLNMNGENLGHPTRLVSALNWLDLRGSSYCPQCLAEDEGAWQAIWRFPWIYACTRHLTLMTPTCPTCHEIPGRGRHVGILGTPFPTWIPSPTHCPNPTAKEQRKAGRAARPCATDLTQTPPGADINPDDVALLSSLTERMGVPEAPENLRIWWSDLRSICSALLAVGESDTLTKVMGQATPNASHTIWTEWIQQRQELQLAAANDYHRLKAPEENPRHRQQEHARLHTWHRAPKDPALMRTILPAALAILDDTDGSTLSRAYLTSRRHHTGHNWLPLRLREAGLSKPMRQRMHEVVLRTKFSRSRAMYPCHCAEQDPAPGSASRQYYSRQLQLPYNL